MIPGNRTMPWGRGMMGKVAEWDRAMMEGGLSVVGLRDVGKQS